MSGTEPTTPEAAVIAVERLRAHEEELRALGVRSLSVFGSIARGLGSEFARGGFEYFGKLERLRDQLSSILGRPVDVIENARAIRGYVEGIDIAGLRVDSKTRDAVER